MSTETTLTISALGRHGDGIAETESGAVYVPFTLPGETVRAHIEGRRGRLVEILAPSPDRIAPLCPHFGTCGGCAAQHWRHGAYAAWKRGLVATALKHRRIDAPVDDLVDAHGAGRRRATLHIRFAGDKVLAGFMEARSHRLIDLDACPILVPALNDAAAIARALAAPLAGPVKALDMLLTATESGLDADLRGAVAVQGQTQLALTDAAAEWDLARLTVNRELVIERRPPRLCIGTATVVLPPGGFLQATAAGEDALAALVLEGVGDAARIADLFCGIGPFALQLAERASCFAFDSDARALDALSRAARQTGGLKPVQAARRDLFRDPLPAAALDRFDAVVFDPPRAGAEAQAAELAGSKVPVVVAVSCDPASFARDASILIDGGYRIDRVTPVDQFRHSAHVETVAVLRRD
ncbi:MAG: class I SAM-dependent RNA methyltransferase [Rhodospirillales bacterium]|nr:MAG: class I SAM-dependent RNA methyltransferase [Rhodospirillales bacterium]